MRRCWGCRACPPRRAPLGPDPEVRAAGQRLADLGATLGEIVESCHGFDPLHTETRALLADLGARIGDLAEVVQEVDPDFAIPDAHPAAIDHLHKLLSADRVPE